MFLKALQDANAIAQACLFEALPKSKPLAEPMAYAIEGGKGLRGFLVMEGAQIFGISPEISKYPAAGIEAMHACSLVHDDLPCMDDDDLRRGRPTVHRKWDNATAVLVGDALQSVAFELAGHRAIGNDAIRADLCISLARGAGGEGMVRGQALDLAAEVSETPLTLDEIIELQAGKTGALFEWSTTAGARLAGEDLEPLRKFGEALGLAFQIADDILDIESDAETLGKATQKDETAGKATFVTLLGLEGAKARGRELVEAACDAVSIYGNKANTLREAAEFAISRKK